ncbi:MAG: thioredoxin family protein [DPANN group archaeon]|nr:thioredoxin family protein [DPANN group archaeon]
MISDTVKLAFIVILIIGTISYLEATKSKIVPITAIGPDGGDLLKEMMYKKAPELVGISGYLNTDEKEIKISDYKGKVVLIDFWTYTCINCIRTLPHLTEWDRKYRDQGLVIIGVHTPEFAFEKIRENVENAIHEHNIEYAVVQDNDYATWRAFQNRFWPHKFLIDKDGFIRYDHIGEGAYEETERQIQLLLSETGAETEGMNLTGLKDETPRVLLTPELYAGYNFAIPRGQNIGNPGGMKPGQTIKYELPATVRKDIIYLKGTWLSNPDDLHAQDSEGAEIVLDFTASKVNIVADSVNGPLELEVLINDAPATQTQLGSDVQIIGGKAIMTVDRPRLYNVINGEYGNYKLTLRATNTNFIFSAFTFG